MFNNGSKLVGYLVPKPLNSDVSNFKVFKFFVLIFLATNIIYFKNYNMNILSRLALLRSMTFDYSFKINNHVHLTIDWSKTPNGNFYSNKAPGPCLIAFPVYFVMAKITYLLVEKNIISYNNWHRYIELFILHFICVIFQVIPFAFIIWKFVLWLSEKGYDSSAINFFILGTFFGNTSSFFMSSFFGHGFAAMTVMFSIFFLLKNKWFFSGLFLGLSILSDYSSVFLFPLIFIGYLKTLFKKNNILKFLLGVSVFMALFALYNFICFGSPIHTAFQYENPELTEKKMNLLFGIFSLPRFGILIELLFGPSRGLLFTQPQILFGMFFLIVFMIKNRMILSTCEYSSLFFVTLTFLGVLLIFNSSFNGWHGGGSHGPRYLSVSFPPLILSISLLWPNYSSFKKRILWVLLGISIFLYILVIGAPHRPGPVPIWTAVLSYYVAPWDGVASTLRLLSYIFLIWFLNKKYLKKSIFEIFDKKAFLGL